MASSISLASPILLLILFHLLLETDHLCFASNPTGKKPDGLRLALTPVDFSKNQPKNQYALSSLSKAKNQPKDAVRSLMKASSDVYLTELYIGSPPVKFSAVVDTGSDLIWTKCQSSSRFYDWRKSKSFSKVSCNNLPDGCNQTYADGSSIKVRMGREMFAMGYISRNLTFACGKPRDKLSKRSVENYDGIVGMRRGPLSLVSQLNMRVFSYCLASRFHGDAEQSILQTGSLAVTAIANTKIQTTPLFKQENYSYYYISLEGISVGETRLPVNKSDFEIKEDNTGRMTGGMIIDSGTTFTYLEEGIVNLIKDEFMKQTNLEKVKGDTLYKEINDQCFQDVKIIPKLVFHFSGADWDLPRENYMYKHKGAECLAFIPIEKNDEQRLSVFGNMQQQNMMVFYDLDKERLSFMPANCNQL